MKSLKIGILGASGLVGEAILECIDYLKLPVSELRCFVSERSLGKSIYFRGNDYKFELMCESRISDLDVLFGATSAQISKLYVDMIRKSHVLYIDNSSAFRLNENVPLIIPEINLSDVTCQKLISNPNCSTILTLMAVYPIHLLFGLQRMIVSTYQAVSGAGKRGMDELIRSFSNESNDLFTSTVFPQTIMNNLISAIVEMMDNGYTSEEVKMENEARKILHCKDLEVICTCVRVPVLRCHSISIYCECDKEVDVDLLVSYYNQISGIKLSQELPSPYHCSKQLEVHVGRLRKDHHHKNTVVLWACGDQIYKGAALNAVQIAQSILLK
ncbi:MAG: aspartate-semialdehyde dehydrogenase [Erysipelotrichaceae bacterium]|nr:aspartate-semialdehyde dehydrogenase [Erysipelotrichaceae bacterium]